MNDANYHNVENDMWLHSDIVGQFSVAPNFNQSFYEAVAVGQNPHYALINTRFKLLQ